MDNSKKIKKVYICPTCRGNGFIKVSNIFDNEHEIHQCFDCESQGEVYDYEDSNDFDIDDAVQSVH
jgi:DnaJ-class molecular chaperone